MATNFKIAAQIVTRATRNVKPDGELQLHLITIKNYDLFTTWISFKPNRNRPREIPELRL